ncbi:MAG TPA: hypothetical protein V6D34_19110, partial [Candidatus Sericytochromatia bacterium]
MSVAVSVLIQRGRYWALAGLAIVLAIALSACQAQNLKSQAARIPQLVISTTTDPKTFNYALNN